jgi:HEPN domain-containing protein/predicted nucleotidyltransferase
MREETKNWLEFAKEDLNAARDNLEINYYRISVFLSQQAIEKSLKALIIEEQEILIRTHSLSQLGFEANIDDEMITFFRNTSKIYINTRYPDGEHQQIQTKFTISDAQKFLECAEKVMALVVKRVNNPIKKSNKLVKENETSYEISDKNLYNEPDPEAIKLLSESKKIIEQKIRLDKMYLFGSRARGDYKKFSDIDVILVSDDFKDNDNENFALNSITYKNGADILCLTKKEFERKKNMITIVADAMKYAIEIK